MSQPPKEPTNRQKRVIYIPSDLKKHQNIVQDAEKYREFLDKVIKDSL